MSDTVSGIIGHLYALGDTAPDTFRKAIQEDCDRLLAIVTRDGMAEWPSLMGETAVPVQVLEAPTPQSSVEIAGRQKGPPAVTVKVYAADPVAARNAAVRIYNETVRMLEGHDSE